MTVAVLQEGSGSYDIQFLKVLPKFTYIIWEDRSNSLDN